jgi:hypothetical protein
MSVIWLCAHLTWELASTVVEVLAAGGPAVATATISIVSLFVTDGKRWSLGAEFRMFGPPP